MTARIDRSTIDVAHPPEGVTLQIGGIAAQLRVSISDMADATGLGRSTVWNICSRNRWPVGRDAGQLRDALSALMRGRGASDQQLEKMFHAYLPKLGRPPLDRDERADRTAKTDEGEIDVLLPKQSLTLAARKAFNLHFGLSPLGEVTDEAQMFNNDEFRYVREACLAAALHGSFLAVVGESGAGKTTLLEDLTGRLARERKHVTVIKPPVLGMAETKAQGHPLKAADILQVVIKTLDPTATVANSLTSRSTQAEKLLVAAVEAGFQHVLVIEEAHAMSDFTLKHLKRMNELKLGRKPLMGILLLAQPELIGKLDPKRTHMREVSQRCEIVRLLPLDSEIKPYLTHRFSTIGRALSEFIDDDGVNELRSKLLRELNEGGGRRRVVDMSYPLAVNNLMTAALNTAAELGVPLVTRDVVRAV